MLVLSNLAKYLANADECRRMAKEVRDEHIREQWLAVARQWDELAESVKLKSSKSDSKTGRF
jgi:uncharacterized alpha-E superfamily protein